MAATRMRSPLGRAIGLGSAKEGVEHWWLPARHRGGAGARSLCGSSIAVDPAAPAPIIDAVRDWVGRPLPAILLVLLLIATFWHASLGLQVVIEDYVHAERCAKLGLSDCHALGCASRSLSPASSPLAQRWRLGTQLTGVP